MILAIDIGNTNIVLGCMEHDRILVEARMATDLLKTSDQYCVELKNLLNLYEVDLQAIEGVIISSVVPPVLNSCRTAVRKLTGKTPMIVGPGIRTGLNIQMENPAQIGSDLIVAAVAALSRFEPPLIIIDMGTATTIGQAMQYGWQDVFSLLALITINIGIFNLLPIPALDGCKLLFLAWEGLTGHPVPPRVQGVINTAGTVALVWLMILVTMHDISRFL